MEKVQGQWMVPKRAYTPMFWVVLMQQMTHPSELTFLQEVKDHHMLSTTEDSNGQLSIKAGMDLNYY